MPETTSSRTGTPTLRACQVKKLLILREQETKSLTMRRSTTFSSIPLNSMISCTTWRQESLQIIHHILSMFTDGQAGIPQQTSFQKLLRSLSATTNSWMSAKSTQTGLKRLRLILEVQSPSWLCNWEKSRVTIWSTNTPHMHVSTQRSNFTSSDMIRD